MTGPNFGPFKTMERINTTEAQERTAHELALAKMLGRDPYELDDDGEFKFRLKPTEWDHYGLTVYEVEDEPGEYAIGTDEEADEAAEQYIRDSAWAFRASWIADYCAAPAEMIEAYQRDKDEGANEAIIDLIGERWDEFVSDSISADGRGHFMNSYDGHELEAKIGDDYYYGYRVN